MDLVYANKQGIDIGVINFYDFDLAYGRDENDFQLTISLQDHCCDIGYIIYIDGTEYGGIIDSVKVDIEKDTVIYSGRTWHGILNSKVIEDSKVVTGDAHDILRELIIDLDFFDLFSVKRNSSGVNIVNYEFSHYAPSYDEIFNMLINNNAKLNIAYNSIIGKVELSVNNRISYVNDDYFDSNQLNFIAEKSQNVPNHVICVLANDTEEKRIDLFTDENGVLQTYQKSDSLIDEERYYLDKSQQVIFGKDEKVKVIESGIDVREIFHPIESIPSDWVSNFENYWHQVIDEDGNVSYEQNEYIEEPYYIKMPTKPDDWETNYENFYVYSGVNNEYINVSAVNNNSYELLASEPQEWDSEYTSYFIKVGSRYENVSGIEDDSMYQKLVAGQKPKDWATDYGNYFEKDFSSNTYNPVTPEQSDPDYNVLPGRPLDWENNLSSYYYLATKYKQKNVGGQIIAIENGSGWLSADKYYAKDGSGVKTFETTPNYKQGKYFTKDTKDIAPMWIAERYYAKVKEPIAPTWQANTYYVEKPNPQPPTFTANTYFRQSIHKYAKVWIYGQYFRKQNDHYITAIENAVSELQDEWNTRDKLDIDLPEMYTYDIGDIVGATEHITMLEVAQLVTKKIVKIENGIVTISYEIGREK